MTLNLLECSEADMKRLNQVHKLVLNWPDDDLTLLNTYKISDNENIIALIEWTYERKESRYHIDSFEVIDKGKGHGSEIIKGILEELETGETIQLYCHNEKSRRFWEMNNFIPHYQSGGSIVHIFRKRN